MDAEDLAELVGSVTEMPEQFEETERTRDALAWAAAHISRWPCENTIVRYTPVA
ncbi:hypothetical protein [Streptomyces bacillaris]|uniref:hypothetical protein n=1 Tax=Streptomyces bacillaris TaxID=68179 RepID=UPI0036656E7F